MSKRKGLSVEEKRQKMLELFHEKKEFFNLKELEKLAPREKGIVSQSVKEVVQSLVDDGLVDSDKIGSSIYFWSYPSKALHLKKCKLEELRKKADEATKKAATTEEFVAAARMGREETDERKAVLARLEALEKEKTTLVEELKRFHDQDPEVLEETRRQIGVAKEAVNRWTDNIFSLKGWCKSKFCIEESVLNKQFGIDEDMDYVD